MKEAEIIVAVFPQSDGSLKRRPALILREMPPFRDFLICGISTQLRQKVEDFDEIISETDEDFVKSGLESESLIRLGFFYSFAARANHRLNRLDFRSASSTIIKEIERIFN